MLTMVAESQPPVLIVGLSKNEINALNNFQPLPLALNLPQNIKVIVAKAKEDETCDIPQPNPEDVTIVAVIRDESINAMRAGEVLQCDFVDLQIRLLVDHSDAALHDRMKHIIRTSICEDPEYDYDFWPCREPSEN